MKNNIINYDYGRKRNWRRWVWNEISRRVDCSKKDAVVLYLPGENNLDAQIAEEKGFDIRNMIAVERDPNTVKKLRAMGVNVVNGDLSEVVSCWRGEPRISAIIADFTCGMNKGALEFQEALLAHIIINIWRSEQLIVCVNLLRGRDAFFNEIKSNIEEIIKYNTDNNKHRGVQFFANFISIFCLGFGAENSHQLSGLLGFFQKFVFKKCIGMSYRNPDKRQTFDSCLFTIDFRILRKHLSDDAEKRFKIDNRMKLRIAAAKAVRTSRLYSGAANNHCFIRSK